MDWIKTHRTKTKTKANIPLLPIPKNIISKHARLQDLHPDETIFKVYSNQKINDYLKVLAKLANIEKKVSFHIARHTFATTITLQNGIPIETVSKMLGHTNIKTTQHYAKVLDSKISKDMEILKSHYLRIAWRPLDFLCPPHARILINWVFLINSYVNNKYNLTFVRT